MIIQHHPKSSNINHHRHPVIHPLCAILFYSGSSLRHCKAARVTAVSGRSQAPALAKGQNLEGKSLKTGNRSDKLSCKIQSTMLFFFEYYWWTRPCRIPLWTLVRFIEYKPYGKTSALPNLFGVHGFCGFFLPQMSFIVLFHQILSDFTCAAFLGAEKAHATWGFRLITNRFSPGGGRFGWGDPQSHSMPLNTWDFFQKTSCYAIFFML